MILCMILLINDLLINHLLMILAFFHSLDVVVWLIKLYCSPL